MNNLTNSPWLMISAIVGFTLSGFCVACVPAGTLPGSLEVTKSKFDDRQYVRVEPGWVNAINGGIFTEPPFKLDALIHSEGGILLVARIEGITRITDLEVRVDPIV